MKAMRLFIIIVGVLVMYPDASDEGRTVRNRKEEMR